MVLAFPSLARIWGRQFNHSFPACAFVVVVVVVVDVEVEISSRTLVPLFMPGPVHSGCAS